MESTGIYWKAIYSILERTGLNVYVVNARHAKNLPGRKTDVQDSKWLTTLARFGLLSPSFIPPEDLRKLRLMTRRRMKMQGILSGEKNRLHKILDDTGIRLGAVVSDINGVSAQVIIDGLIRGESPGQLMQYVRGRLKVKIPELLESLEGTSSIFACQPKAFNLQTSNSLTGVPSGLVGSNRRFLPIYTSLSIPNPFPFLLHHH
jgi:transposase